MRSLRRYRFIAFFFLASTCVLAGATTPTTTSLSVMANGSPTSSVLLGSPITLIATVASGSGTPRGRVNFCNADAPVCTGPSLLGYAEVTPAGTASMVLRPRPATRHYRATFIGNLSFGTSSSSVIPIAVTGTLPTTSTFQASGSIGNYTLTSSVTAQTLAAPAGTVEFQDTSSGNASVAHAVLGTSSRAPVFAKQPLGIDTGFIASAQPVDFDNDGFQDLVITDIAYDAGVYLSDGEGGLISGPGFNGVDPNGFGVFPRGDLGNVVTADFDRDGQQDFAFFGVNYETDPAFGTPVLLLHLGNSNSVALIPTAIRGTILAGDFNGDGLQDILIVGGTSDATETTYLLLAGKGDGTFTPSTSGDVGVVSVANGGPKALAVDLNGDGVTDFLFASSTSVVAFLNQGNGTFTPHTTPVVPGSQFGASLPLVADVNNDGEVDMISDDGGTGVYLGNGDGTFQSKRSIAATGGFFMQAVDFDTDGNIDVILNNTLYLGHGDGTFSAGQLIPFQDPTANALDQKTAADLDGDGRPDMVMQEASPEGSPTNVTTFLNRSTQTASTQATGVSIPGSGPHFIAAHFDGDMTNAPSTSSTILLNAGGNSADQTTTLVTLSNAAIAFDSTVMVTASVHDLTNSSGVPSGKVGFYDQSTSNTLIGYVALSGGQASFAFKPLSVGQHHIVASFTPSDTTHFNPSVDNFGKTLTVQPIPATITFSIPQHTFGDPAFFLGATSNSPVQITYSVVRGPAQVFGQRLALLGTGAVVVRADQAAQGSFGAGATETSFSVGKSQQTCTFLPPPSMVTVGADPIPLHVISSTGQSVFPQVQSGPAFVTVSFTGDSTLTVTGPGTVVVSAQHPGNDDFYASRKITYSIKVNPRPQK
jgi:hypothetical protein